MRSCLGWSASITALCLAAPASVLAQAASEPAAESSAAPPALKVGLLRATEGDAGGLADSVDGALLRDLASLAGIENPTVSPIDYAEIQLTVGCSDEGRQCLAAIAKLLQVDAVLVRRLQVGPDKSTLTLVHFDATASDEPAHAEQVAEGPDAGNALVDSVPSLVRRLFGIPEPISAAAPEAQPAAPAAAATPAATQPPAPRDDAGTRIGALTWVALGAGVAVLGTGIAFGLSAQSSFDAFKRTSITSADDAKTADSRFDSAQSKGTLATVLIPSGAALIGLGATLLVLDLSSGEQAPEVSLAPLPHGALLSMRARGVGL